jgi:UDP-glucose 4-epimerase
MNYNYLIKKKKILITGGAGFVGSNLAKRLYENDNTVYVLDNYFTGNQNNHIKGVIYKKGETKNIFKYYKSINLDYIFHLGEYSRVEQSYQDINLVIQYNTYPFYEVLKLASHNKAKLIYSGSSTKFSKNLDVVESPYSFSKRINTELLVKYAKWFNISYAITYFYNVYGPNEISKGKYATVIAKFLKLKKQKIKFLPINKPGTQKRRFTHIDDVINGLILVAKKGNGDDFGIGADKAYNIIEIAKMLNMNFRLKSKKKGNRLDATLKTQRTKKLGWKAKYNLRDYIKSNLENL